MRKWALALLLCAALSLTACAKGPGGMPYPAWYLGFYAPAYMEAWIETAQVLDSQGRVFVNAGSGSPSINTSPSLKANPRGWNDLAGWGTGKHIRGAALPRMIYVRWQSLVEPQTYEARIPIDEATRKAMARPERTFCEADATWITDYRDGIGIGLAPGGIVKVSISGQCLHDIPVTRLQATVVKRGPYRGLSGGHYYPLGEASKAYIKRYGIPYGSW